MANYKLKKKRRSMKWNRKIEQRHCTKITRTYDPFQSNCITSVCLSPRHLSVCPSICVSACTQKLSLIPLDLWPLCSEMNLYYCKQLYVEEMITWTDCSSWWKNPEVDYSKHSQNYLNFQSNQHKRVSKRAGNHPDFLDYVRDDWHIGSVQPTRN